MLGADAMVTIINGRERARLLYNAADEAESTAYRAYLQAQSEKAIAKGFYDRLCGFNGFIWQAEHYILTAYTKTGKYQYNYYRYFLQFGNSCTKENYLFIEVKERPEKKRDKWQVNLYLTRDIYTYSAYIFDDNITLKDAERFTGDFNFKTLDSAENFAREKITEFNKFLRGLPIYKKTIDFLSDDVDALDEIPALKDAAER